jgi:transposase
MERFHRMSRFIAVDRDTDYLLPPSVSDWLPQDHLARFVVEVIDQLDLSELVGQYAGRGSQAWHPAMLLGLLVYGYATGVHSSRKIERACHDSVAFRFIAANTQPDHDSIATFRRRFLPQIEALFVQVLVLAHEMKCLRLGNIALDGTKIAANASKHKALSWEHANKIEAQLREEVQLLLRLAEDSDSRAVNDGLDVPAEIARRGKRLAAIAQAKTRIEERARERHDIERQEYEAKCARRDAQREAGKKPRGPDPQPPSGEPKAGDQVNLTDEDSRIMPISGAGFEQGYNAQAAVDGETMMVVIPNVSQAPNDKREITAVLQKVQALPQALGQVAVLLGDTGYFSAANVNACEAHGIEPLLAIKRESHHLPVLQRFAADAPAPDTDDPLARMAHRLGTKEGRALYGLRKQTVEPVFGIIKRVMGWSQMSMRGLDKARGEWSLVTMSWNIKRLHVLRAA